MFDVEPHQPLVTNDCLSNAAPLKGNDTFQVSNLYCQPHAMIEALRVYEINTVNPRPCLRLSVPTSPDTLFRTCGPYPRVLPS